MENFNLNKWKHIKCLNKDEATKELNNFNIIGNEIQEIIILDRDEITDDSHYLFNTYTNNILRKESENGNVFKLKIKEFIKQHKKINIDDFPKNFKYMYTTYSNMPLILKMKNGDCIELYYWEHCEEETLYFKNELLLSKNELNKYISKFSPVMNYKNLYSFILNKKIVDISFDNNKYEFKNDINDSNEIKQLNIEFENGYVMQLFKSGPNTGYFIAIWDINNQTYEIFTIQDFANNYLENIESINKV